MNDFDRFERRLAAALRSDADQSVARFEPASVAQAAIASGRPRSRRRRLGTALGFGRPTIRASYLLVVLGLVVALVVGAIVAGALRTRPVGPSGWVPTSDMIEARVWHTATLLSGGKVLVVGGSGSPGSDSVASAELYDPGTRSWAATGSMAGARNAHTATLLPDGTVLVAGCFGVASAELYDPKSGTWAPTGAMIADRAYHTATLLPDGRVLVVGGFSGSTPNASASAEFYDPRTGTWAPTGRMAEARAGHTATLLPDGKVLVTGGSISGGSYNPTPSAELYDPGTGSWAATGSMSTARVYATATLLADGTVLVAGGSSRTSNNDPAGPVAPAELYHPDSTSWTATTRMTEARTYPTATLLKDGQVLVTGGRTQPILGSSLASAELYGPASGTR